MNQDPHIQAAVMFGRGKFNAGVLIDPRPAFVFDPTDQGKLVDFRNKIWYVEMVTIAPRVLVKLGTSGLLSNG